MPREKNKQLARKILKSVLWSGMFVVACSSPNFVPKILPRIARLIAYAPGKKNKDKKKRGELQNTFNYLRYKGLLEIRNKKGQIYIFLTKEGKRLAGKYQINDLQIKKPKKWDKLWRILIFDIKEGQKKKREALRGKIKELGLFQLQKSVWVCPYNFFKEISLLRDFFGLDKDEMKIITAYEIENDGPVKKFFGLG
jgi:CRISPR-associated endonuclease Cas2